MMAPLTMKLKSPMMPSMIKIHQITKLKNTGPAVCEGRQGRFRRYTFILKIDIHKGAIALKQNVLHSFLHTLFLHFIYTLYTSQPPLVPLSLRTGNHRFAVTKLQVCRKETIGLP